MAVSCRLPNRPLSGEAQSFLDFCLDRDMAITTVETYAQVLSTFASWMEANYPQVSSVSQISLAHLQHFRRHLRLSSAAAGRELSSGTLAKYLSTLRSLLRYCSVQLGAAVVAREHLSLPQGGERPARQPVSRDDLDKLLASPPADKPWGLRDRAIVALLGLAGLRLNELCALDRRQVREDLLTREPTMTVAMSVAGGPRGSRQVVLDERSQRYLLDYLRSRHDNYPPLFIRHKPGKVAENDDSQHRLTRQMVNRMLVKHAKRAGLLCLPTAPSLRQGASTRSGF
jgi:integrase/recombinase XerD